MHTVPLSRAQCRAPLPGRRCFIRRCVPPPVAGELRHNRTAVHADCSAVSWRDNVEISPDTHNTVTNRNLNKREIKLLSDKSHLLTSYCIFLQLHILTRVRKNLNLSSLFYTLLYIFFILFHNFFLFCPQFSSFKRLPYFYIALFLHFLIGILPWFVPVADNFSPAL